MAFTLFGSATNPADNTALAGPTVALTPPASMADGDLVMVSVRYAASSGTLAVSNAGGQNWSQVGAQYNTTNIRAAMFWCRFNGTWSANPSFTVTSGTNNMDAQMLVFRPTSSAYTLSVESGPNAATYAAPTTPFTVSITGRTTVAASTVTVALWHSIDDNSWGTLAGTGWSKTSLTAQYRNNSTNDNSSSFAYYIASAAGTAIPNVSQNQTALGGDAGSTALVTFAEVLTNVIPTGVAATAAAGLEALSNVAVGIQGVEGTTAAGVASVPSGSVSVVPVGVSSAAAAGALVSPGSAIAAVTGVAATSTAGIVGAAVITTLSGVAATASAGAVTGVVPGTAFGLPTGVTTNAVAGSLAAASVVVGIAGVAASAQAGVAVGAVVGSGSVVVVPTGVSGTATPGSLAAARVAVGVVGVASTAQAGAVLTGAAGLQHGTGQPNGVVALATAGAPSMSLTAALVGVSTAVSAEFLDGTIVISEVDGVAATAAAGTPVVNIGAVQVQGVACIAAAGAPTATWSSVPVVPAVSSIATVGTVAGFSNPTVTAVAAGVAASAVAGVIAPAHSAVAPIVGVQSTSVAQSVVPVGGDTVPDEVNPAGVAASAQVGTLTISGSMASPFGVAASAIAGHPLGIANSPANVINIDAAGSVQGVRARASIRGVRASGRR